MFGPNNYCLCEILFSHAVTVLYLQENSCCKLLAVRGEKGKAEKRQTDGVRIRAARIKSTLTQTTEQKWFGGNINLQERKLILKKSDYDQMNWSKGKLKSMPGFHKYGKAMRDTRSITIDLLTEWWRLPPRKAGIHGFNSTVHKGPWNRLSWLCCWLVSRKRDKHLHFEDAFLMNNWLSVWPSNLVKL